MTDDPFPYESGDDSEPSRVVHYKDFKTTKTADIPGAQSKEEAYALLSALLDSPEADEYDKNYAAGLVSASERLEEYFPSLVFTTMLNGACPVQGEGFFKGVGVYFRYRSDHATIRISEPDGSLGDLLASQDQVSGDRYRGSMTEQEAVRVFRRLLKKAKKALKKRAKEQR